MNKVTVKEQVNYISQYNPINLIIYKPLGDKFKCCHRWSYTNTTSTGITYICQNCKSICFQSTHF